MNEKTCVVAGVGPGIGKACCEHYAQQGYRVVMPARQQDYLTELASTMPANTISIAVDLSEETAVNQAFTQIEEQCGAVDTLIYNAARGSFGSFLDAKPADLEKNFAINTMGLLYCARACAPKMIKRAMGSILVTGNTTCACGVPSNRWCNRWAFCPRFKQRQARRFFYSTQCNYRGDLVFRSTTRK